jgi:hypothetical protein
LLDRIVMMVEKSLGHIELNMTGDLVKRSKGQLEVRIWSSQRRSEQNHCHKEENTD